MKEEQSPVRQPADTAKKRAPEVYIRNLQRQRGRILTSQFGERKRNSLSELLRKRCAIFARRLLGNYENAAETPDVANTKAAHHPNTTAIEVPRFTFVRQENPIPLRTRVQMVKTSRDTATL